MIFTEKTIEFDENGEVDFENKNDIMNQFKKNKIDLNCFKLLRKNPKYTSIENSYNQEQAIKNKTFEDLSELKTLLDENKNLQIVNYSYFINIPSDLCQSCNGSGYPPIANVFMQTFYSNYSTTESFKTIKNKDNKEEKSFYGWGSNLNFTESDFQALKEVDYNQDCETLEEYLLKANSKDNLFSRVSSTEAHFISVARGKQRGENDQYCPDCFGNQQVYLENEEIEKNIHFWVINHNDGGCFGIDVCDMNEQDINETVDIIKDAKEKMIKQFTHLKNKWCNSLSEHYWRGEVNQSLFGEHDDFSSFYEAWDKPDDWNEFVAYYIEGDSIKLWALHPRKGYSTQVQIKQIKESEKVDFIEYVDEILKRINLLFGNISL